MAALTVPTIFTAVDKLSGVVERMKRSVGGFAGKASIGINALNKGLNSLLPSFGGMLRRYGSLARDFAFFTVAAFSFKTILNYERSLAHLHGLLNTLSDSGFKPYQKEIDRVAKATQYSAADVADAFTKISERNIALAKTPKSLGDVTSAAITLSRAAKMELVPATESLVNVLFQFGLAGKDSNRVINVLAAGMVRGSSNIENQIEAYKKFAVTARGANLTLEQSNALIQTVAHQVQGSDAGTALRNIILNLERYKQVYKNGKFDINYALDATAAHLAKLGTEQKQNIFLQDLFGKRQVNAARQLLENIPLFKRLTEEITGTSEAQKLAEKNTDNVTDSWKMLVAQYQNYITSSDNTLKGLKRLKDAIKYVTKNLDEIIGYIVTFVKWFVILKGIIWACQIALAAYNIVLGITGALTGRANIAIGESVIALRAYKVGLWATTGAAWAFGDALASFKLGTFSGFLGGSGKLLRMAGVVYLVVDAIKNIGTSWNSITDSFMNGSIWVGFSKLIRSGIILPLMNLTGYLNEFFGWIGKLTNMQWLKNLNSDSMRPMTDAQKQQYIDTGHWDLQNQQKPPLGTTAAKSATITNNNNTKNSLDVNFNDPFGIVKSTQGKGPMAIPVTVTSTTGNK